MDLFRRRKTMSESSDDGAASNSGPKQQRQHSAPGAKPPVTGTNQKTTAMEGR